MWFAKWFGGNNEVEDTDEPARFAAPAPRASESAAPTIVGKKKPPAGKGFDPYNSGSFEKRNAWEKVSKRLQPCARSDALPGGRMHFWGISPCPFAHLGQ